MSKEYIISACSGMKIDVKQGQSITVIDIEGGQVVDFFAEADGNENEFLSAGVTIDCNESLKINVGDIIYTNLYHPMMEVMFDDVGEHDLLHPCCRPEMYDFFYPKIIQIALTILTERLESNVPLSHPLIYLCTRKLTQTAVFQWKNRFQKQEIKLY